MDSNSILTRSDYKYALLDIRSRSVKIWLNEREVKLNDISALIWFCIDDGVTLKELIESLGLDNVKIVVALKKMIRNNILQVTNE